MRNTRLLNEPEPGFFKMRLIRGGPWVPAKIVYGPPTDPETGEALDRPHLWETWINGTLIAVPSPDPWKARVDRVWHGAHPLDYENLTSEAAEKEYDYMLRRKDHAEDHGGAEAAPRTAVDIRKTKPRF